MTLNNAAVHLAVLPMNAVWHEPPLTPDADTARELLKSELSNPIYQRGESWIARILMRIQEWLMSLQGPSFSVGTTLIILVVCVLLLAAVFIVAGPLRRVRKTKASKLVFEDTTISAAAYLERAQSLAAQQQFSEACVEMFRAVIRNAEENSLITPSSGRTALEASSAMGVQLEEFAGELTLAAGIFDAVEYGNSTATPEDFADLDALFKRTDAAMKASPRSASLTTSGGAS